MPISRASASEISANSSTTLSVSKILIMSRMYKSKSAANSKKKLFASMFDVVDVLRINILDTLEK